MKKNKDDMNNKRLKNSKKKSSKKKEEFTVQEYEDKFKSEKENNTRQNQPIWFLTYVFSGIFLLLILYVIKFIGYDAKSVISNTYNKRTDLLAEDVIRGDILTSDGKIIATTMVEEDGEEIRSYPYGRLYAHVGGYLTNGKSGLELYANYYLLSSHSNIFDRIALTLSSDKYQGDQVITTIDSRLQQASYDALGSSKGAIVVLEPDTGKILAMVSKPDYDPNEIDVIWSEIVEKEENNSVLLNRASCGKYSPGSTFKVITALEFIRENNNYSEYVYDCKGTGIFQSVSIQCANGKAHGEVSLADALAYSCNGYFASSGLTLNQDKLNQLTKDFYFEKEISFELPYIQSRYYLNASSNRSLIPQTVFGQGDTTLSPLHNAMIYSAIANGGVMMQPYLIDHVESVDGAIVKKFSSKILVKPMTVREAEILSESLKGVCDYGTGKALSNASYDVIGKTGTAQYGTLGKEHGWFVGYSNPENPDIVVSILVEDVGTTGVYPVNCAKKIFDTYYDMVEGS